MLDFFYNNKFDDEIIFQYKSKVYSKKELKQFVSANFDIIKNKKENVVLLPDDNLSFMVNFFTAIFAKKNIYLLDNIQKKMSLEDYDVLKSANLDPIDKIIEFPQVDKNCVLIHLMTSGSSGEPKVIIKSLANLINEAVDINKTFDFGDKKLIVSSTTVFSHLFGLTFALMFPVCNNHVINLEIVEYPDKFNIDNSMLISTPSFLDTVKKNNIVLDNAKFIVTAGAKLNDLTFEYLERYSNVIEIYGSTETGVIAHKESSKNKYLTPFEEVSIISLEGSAVVKTPYAYENEVIINDEIEIVNGQINLKNRSDRLLKICEKRISAEALEKELRLSDFVIDSYCFKSNEKIACLCALSKKGFDYLLKNGFVATVKLLKYFLNDKFSLIPQKWKFIDIIPKNKAGKVDKSCINQIFDINISFPIILNRMKKENCVVLKLYFYRNCNFYKGHFPDFPVTPGVVQLYFASYFGEYFFNKELVGGQMRRIKFSNIIGADEIVDLKLTLNEKSVTYEYYNEEKIFSSGVFSCENILEGV